MRRQVMRITFVATAATLTFALGVGVLGQQAGRDVVAGTTGSVDFVVVTRDGRPVTDLKMDEITVRVNGKPRPIKSLQYIKMAGEIVSRAGKPGAAETKEPVTPVAPAFATNVATTADLPRSIVIVVDDESMPIGQEQRLRASLNDFVRDLPETDKVALVTVPHGGIKAGFTTNRDALRKVINEISPVTPIDAPICRTRLTLSTLETTLSNLARTSEQPIAVAFLSASLMGQSTLEQAPLPNTGRSLSAQAGGCYLSSEDFQKVGQAVAAVRAQLYIIHPDFSQEPAREGIENLRGQTGAPLFHLSASGNTEGGLYRMARETSGYYVAMFDTDPDERGSTRPIAAQVRTTRRDVELRDRPYVMIGRPAMPSLAATTTVTTAFDMVRSGRSFRDLPLRATVSPARNKDGRVTLVVAFEPTDPNVVIMTASAALFDENLNAKEYWQSDKDKMTAWPMSIGLTVPPGKYRLRLGAIDSNGRTGLVDDTVVAELQPAGPLQISGLTLGQNLATGFTPRLLFGKQTSAVAYLELYGATEGQQVNVQFEVSRTTDGQAFYRSPGSVAATAEDGKYAVTTTIPIWALDPGDYVVRAIVQVSGQPAGRVIKTLHKAG